MAIAEDRSYRILDYDALDRLPLGDGIASMFGPDGLVHNAGRPEGFPAGAIGHAQRRSVARLLIPVR